MNSDIPISDQRKLDGKCSICRRKNYCSKRCSSNRHRTNAIIAGKVAEAMGPAFRMLEHYQKF